MITFNLGESRIKHNLLDTNRKYTTYQTYNANRLMVSTKYLHNKRYGLCIDNHSKEIVYHL